MIKYEIRCSDKGEHGDITSFLKNVLIESRKSDEEKVIVFEKGEYHFYQEFCADEIIYASNTDSDRYPDKKIAINIHQIKNLTVEGNGAKFIMHGKIVPVKVTSCENINLKDFSWDFISPTVLEMKVVESGKFSAEYVLPKNSMWDIRKGRLRWYDKSPFTDEFYWREYGDGESYCNVVYDRKSGKMCRYNLNVSPFNFAVKLKKTGDNTVKINYLKPLSELYSEGYTFEMCSSKRRDCVGSFFCESKNISVENVNVRYMSGFGWLVQMCENVSFVCCDFIPERGVDRLCTSFADSIHVSGAKGVIHIENCNFSHAHDDAINIHGTYTLVNSLIDGKTLKLSYAHNQQNGFVQYHEGDKVVFYSRDNLSCVADGEEFTVKRVDNPLCNGNSVKDMIVEFYETLPDILSNNEKYVCENVTYTPEVYIGSCSISTLPTRGILCTTRKKTIIENNIFDNLTMACIYLSNDCNDWYESGPIHDMTIRNNSFYVRKSDSFKGKKGAILIEPIIANHQKGTMSVHRNITVENNAFYMEHDNVINAKYTDNITVKGNVINYPENKKDDAFVFDACKGVDISENMVTENADISIFDKSFVESKQN